MATLQYETPQRPTGTWSRLLALAIGTALATPVWAVLCPDLVSCLPRPMQGESVSIPFVACALPYLAVPVLLPAAFLRKSSWRILCACSLLALTLGWYYGLGFHVLLFKAWRRGL